MNDDKSDAAVVTEEPGKKEGSNETMKQANEDDIQPSLNPLTSAWISTGASWKTNCFQTINTFDLVKRDLAEFGDAMTQEVAGLTNAAKGGIGTATSVIKEQAHYLEKLVTPDEEMKPAVVKSQSSDNESTISSIPNSRSTEESLATKVEKSATIGFGWVKSVVSTVTDTVKSLAIEETTDGEDEITEVVRPRIFRKTNLPREKLLEMQSSEDTFRREPENFEAYTKWMNHFNIEEYDAEINVLLGSNPSLRKIYSKMVPSDLDGKTFWSRYFYAIQIAEMDEELRMSFCFNELSVDTGTEARKIEKVNRPSSSVSPIQNCGSSPMSDESIAVVDHQPTSAAASADDWSVCSDKNYVEEICSTNGDDEQAGPLTPRAKCDKESSKEKEVKDENWVDWDE
ncbi:BSD domain protein [Dictyocaulus viviparus]|uniref:BSD domain protein n=1 Tax=Dictyocaulus viviparus TaxID=29172 RepID=A0A0D8Y1P9_DICVI|nr:BSD domain protein [Dictyocaulus viviparus]